MLHHDLNSEEATPLPQRRITPDELERAIATLDARRKEQERQQEEEARYLAETLSLEQAVGTLSLDYTPEEIWAEVRQEREHTAELASTAEAEIDVPVISDISAAPLRTQQDGLGDESVQSSQTTYLEQMWSGTSVFTSVILACVTIVGLLIGFASCGQNGHQYQPTVLTPPSIQSRASNISTYRPPFSYINSRARVATTLGDDFYTKLRQSRGPSPRYHIMRIPFYPQGGFRYDETLYPERAVPDGYAIYSASLAISTPSAIVFREVDDLGPSTNASPPRHMFVTTRYDGREYVRCWVRRSDVPAIKRNNMTRLYSPLVVNPKTQSQWVPFTMPADLWLLPRTGTYWNWVHSPHPALTSTIARRAFPQLREKIDNHAWEDFTTRIPPLYHPPSWARIAGVFSSAPDFPDAQDVPTEPYMEFDASSDVKKIGRLLNGQQFHCGPLILKEILQASQRYPNSTINPWGTPLPKTPLSQILVDARPHLHRPYTFVRQNGNLYLRGWVESKMTEEQMRDHTITVHNNPNDPELGYAPTQIQLRIDRCQIDPQITQSYNAEQTIPVSDIHLDEHAWETWKS